MRTLSIQNPPPSIEMRTPAAISMRVKAALVNWLPWSALKISGRPKRAIASCSAETQNKLSLLLVSRPASTAPHRIGDVGAPDLSAYRTRL
jgi:hypothetical protein